MTIDPFLSVINELQLYTEYSVQNLEEPVKKARGRPKKIQKDLSNNSIRHELLDISPSHANLLTDRELQLMKQRYNQLINLGRPIKDSIEVVSAKTSLSYSEAYAIFEK